MSEKYKNIHDIPNVTWRFQVIADVETAKIGEFMMATKTPKSDLKNPFKSLCG